MSASPPDQLDDGWETILVPKDGKSRFVIVVDGIDEETQALNCLIQVLEHQSWWIKDWQFGGTTSNRQLTKSQCLRLSDYLVKRYQVPT